MTRGGAALPQQNVYTIPDATAWPERPDPYIVYHQLYTPGDGLYYWHVGNQQYERLIEVNEALNAFAFAAYGAMNIATPQAFPSLGGAWQPIDNYDANVIAVPRTITTDLAAGTISFSIEGVYFVSFTLIFEHNSSNSGRLTNLRFFNVTDGVQVGTDFTVGTGRNAESTSITVASPIEIDPTNVGDAVRIEIGNGDTYTSMQLDSVLYGVIGAGEFRGTL